MQTNTREPFENKAVKLLQDFIEMEAAGGLLLMAATVLALIVANTPLNRFYVSLLNLPIHLSIGSFAIAKPLSLWINDGLMAIFFFLVGMELKREIMDGELSSLQKASLPLIAAVGGLAAPALIYAAFNWHDSVALRGWAIPAATDIAFALGVLSLLGNRVPTALKAFLLSVAIFDDLGAIIVIAVFYTAELSMTALLVAVASLLVLACINRMGVTRPAAYFLIAVPLWVALLKSGVHATLAGVALAMFIPLRMPGEPLLRKLEHALHPWVAFGVLPIFAFANAGVSFAGMSIKDSLSFVVLGVALGLFVGKQLGIMLTCWLAVRLRVAALPEGIGWGKLYGASALCGIGFTMSLFVASLAFEHTDGLERLGILVGSFVSGLLGYVVLRKVLNDGAARIT